MAIPKPMRSKELQVFDLCSKLTKYNEGLTWQGLLAAKRKAGIVPDSLLLLQHKPVYTLGKRGLEQDFKVPVKDLLNRSIDVEVTPRGGEVTYHGPGQLVVYPIMNLRELGLGARAYVEGLEDTVLRLLAHYGVHGRGHVPGATGIWVGKNKIAAIGVRISHGISSHGFAFNVGGPSLLPAFDAIVPCGFQDARHSVTSLEVELQKAQSWQVHEGNGPEETAPASTDSAAGQLIRSDGAHLNIGGQANTSDGASESLFSSPTYASSVRSSSMDYINGKLYGLRHPAAPAGKLIDVVSIARLVAREFARQFGFDHISYQTLPFHEK